MTTNSAESGFRGQVPVAVDPVEADTPHGRVRAFLTERGGIVVENAPGQALLTEDGYGFVLSLEYGPLTNEGCVVGPYQAETKPEKGHGSERERAARDRVEDALHAVVAGFLAEHEREVLAHAIADLRGKLEAMPEPAERRPMPAKAARSLALETPYGPVLARVVDNGLVEVVGAGFQGSVSVEGRPHELKGTLNLSRPYQDGYVLRPILSTTNRPDYGWKGHVPELEGLSARISADPGMVAASAARALYASEERARMNAVAARELVEANLERLEAHLAMAVNVAAPAPGR